MQADLSVAADVRMLLETVRPDWLYMPHPAYMDWNRAILAQPTFTRDYDYYDTAFTKSAMGVAIRKASPCYAQMNDIVNNR